MKDAIALETDIAQIVLSLRQDKEDGIINTTIGELGTFAPFVSYNCSLLSVVFRFHQYLLKRYSVLFIFFNTILRPQARLG